MIQMNRLPRILFGRGSCQQVGSVVRNELERQNAIVICDPAVRDNSQVVALLDSLSAAGVAFSVCERVVPDPPYAVVDEIGQAARQDQCDVVIGIGGGSALDTAKGVAIAATTGVPLITFAGVDKVPGRRLSLVLVPSTAGTGSEATNVAVFSDHEHNKSGVVSSHIVPDAAMLEPDILRGLPPSVIAITGLDAMAHAMESFVGVYNSFLTEPFALTALRYVAQYLRRAYTDPEDDTAREHMLRASLLGGIAFTNTQTGGAHACAMPLGTRAKLAHGEAVTLMLPAVMRFNLPAATDRYAVIAETFDCANSSMDVEQAACRAIDYVETLATELGVAFGLANHGITHRDIDRLADLSAGNARIWINNPRQPTLEEIKQIYLDAL